MNPALSLQQVYKRMRAYFDSPTAVLARAYDGGEYGPDSSDAGSCMYRTWDGNKCAVGCLIPDANYRPYFEGLGATELVKLLGKQSKGQATPGDFHEGGSNWETFEDYGSRESGWYYPEKEAENARVLHRILDTDPDKVAFLQAAQILHDQESFDADDFVSKLDALARTKGVIE
jgi:hypothetical protein